MVIDPLIPLPPIGGLIDPARERWVIIVMGTAAVLTLIRSLIHWRRSGRPVALMMFIAGGLAVVHEPMVDLLGGCWHYTNAAIAFTAYGRPMPVWLCIAYFFYVGIGLSTIWQLLRRGLTATQIWMVYAVAIFSDCVMEMILLHFNIYSYYGHQPLLMARFPLWWAPVNAGYIITTVTVIRYMDAALQGWRVIAIAPVALFVSAAFNAAAAWPAWFVINTDVGPIGTQIGGLMTFGFAFIIVGMSAQVSAKRTRPRAKIGDISTPTNLSEKLTPAQHRTPHG